MYINPEIFNQALNTVEKAWDITSYGYLAAVTVVGIVGCYKIFVIDRGNPFHF